MQTASETLSLRDQVLRCIGRNVVNFQYLEAMLRAMIPSLAGEVTLTDGKSNIPATIRKHKKSSLGDLADSFLGRIFSTPEPEGRETAETAPDDKFRFSLQLITTPEEAANQRKALLKLVVERNRLIHRDVLEVDLNSPEHCARLLSHLDEQNERIRAQLQFLNCLRQAHREALEEFVRFMETDEFMSALRGQENDA